LQNMKDEFNMRKQKFKDKSDFIALNSTFKVIKNSLDDVKAMIAEHEDAKNIKIKMHEYQKSMVEKEEYAENIKLYNRVRHQKKILEEREKFELRKMQLEPKLEATKIANKKIRKEIEDMDWRARKLRADKKELLKDNKILTDKLVSLKHTSDSQDKQLASLKEKDNEELQNLEDLQTRFYKETVKMANLCEDIDKVMEFVTEFVSKVGSAKKKLGTHMHFKTFDDLQQEDQDNVNDLLSSYGVSFD